MSKERSIDPEFLFLLQMKEGKLVALFKDLREYVLEQYPDCNEILYHTHALSSVFSLSDKAGDSFCMINVYGSHLNLGFIKGTLLKDPYKLLKGTGNLIRHIPIDIPADYRNKKVKDLVKAAADYAMKDVEKPGKVKGLTISKIGKKK
jgi:hypothetical protein